MGSSATADRLTMTNLMQVLLKEQLFFLDSKTGPSVAAKIARQLGIRTLERHLFLDNSDNLADITAQFNTAIDYARKHGNVIIIGHPRKNSIEVLQKRLASLPKDIQLVGLGSLWRDEKVTSPKPFIMYFENRAALTSVAPFKSVAVLRGLPKD
ncbi:polysaccharide deacetylase [[Haemophilus] ducreyi]|nr:polysaccharide deacetylase [[Haemophilus] ducreyi]